MQSAQVFHVQSVNKPHAVCSVLACIVIMNSNYSHVVFQEFVLHTNCPDLYFELGGLMGQFHARERMHGMQFTYMTSRLEYIRGVHFVHKPTQDMDIACCSMIEDRPCYRISI